MDLRAALEMGVTITLDEIQAEEFYALLMIEEERARWEREQAQSG